MDSAEDLKSSRFLTRHANYRPLALAFKPVSEADPCRCLVNSNAHSRRASLTSYESQEERQNVQSQARLVGM